MYNFEPITQLPLIPSLTSNDLFAVVDVTDISESPVGTTKKVTAAQIQSFIIGETDWIVETSGPVTLVAGNGYIANSLSMIDFTLPITTNVGDEFYVEGLGTGLFQIRQNAGQEIIFDSFNTTLGVSGYIQSTNRGDGLTILCVVANTTFKVRSSIGTLLTF
jgi:hypothetical protein